MSPRIAADDNMAKTFIATFRLDGPYRDIVHPDPRQIKIGEIILRMDEIDLYNIKPLRRELFYPMSMERIDELHALVMLGAFSNLDRMLRWISASASRTSQSPPTTGASPEQATPTPSPKTPATPPTGTSSVR
jgi:hypothetical protein